jgi:hypothetical protein
MAGCAQVAAADFFWPRHYSNENYFTGLVAAYMESLQVAAKGSQGPFLI